MPGGPYPPPAVIASWPVPNYVNPETEGPALLYVGTFLSAFGIFVVGARLYSRLVLTKVPGVDDILIVVALVFAIGLSVLIIIGNRVWGIGRHVWDVPSTDYVGSRLNLWCCEWCYIIATSAIKISVLLFYRRLSVSFTRTFLFATWAGIFYNISFLLAISCSLLFSWRPVESYWMSFNVDWDATHTWVAGDESVCLPLSAALSVVGDFYSTLLPLLLIKDLLMPWRQRMALYSLFALGFLVVLSGIVRTIYLNIVINESYDTTWVLWKMWMWAFLEVYVAIFAASAPALKPYFRRFFAEPVHPDSFCDVPVHKKSVFRFNRGRNQTVSSHGGTTVLGGGSYHPTDVESIGLAMGGVKDEESVMQYEVRTGQQGKLVPVHASVPVHDPELDPVPVPVLPQMHEKSSIGNLSMTPTQGSASAADSADWILRSAKEAETTTPPPPPPPLDIEALPPMPDPNDLPDVRRQISLDRVNHFSTAQRNQVSKRPNSTVIGSILAAQQSLSRRWQHENAYQQSRAHPAATATAAPRRQSQPQRQSDTGLYSSPLPTYVHARHRSEEAAPAAVTPPRFSIQSRTTILHRPPAPRPPLPLEDSRYSNLSSDSRPPWNNIQSMTVSPTASTRRMSASSTASEGSLQLPRMGMPMTSRNDSHQEATTTAITATTTTTAAAAAATTTTPTSTTSHRL